MMRLRTYTVLGELALDGSIMDAYTVAGYWMHQDAAGWYTDAVVQGTQYSAKALSVLGQQVKPDGFGVAISAEGGYAFKLGDGIELGASGAIDLPDRIV